VTKRLSSSGQLRLTITSCLSLALYNMSFFPAASPHQSSCWRITSREHQAPASGNSKRCLKSQPICPGTRHSSALCWVFRNGRRQRHHRHVQRQVRPARSSEAAMLRSQGPAWTSATLPSESVVRTWVELSGRTVFITPAPSLCSHLIVPVLASRAKIKSFLVP